MNNTKVIKTFSRAEPDLEFEGLLKRQHTRVKYFQGSLMNAMDLERAKVGVLPTCGGNSVFYLGGGL